ncbi:MAG: hypothetical protein NTY90_05490 [Candidatus Micrarchaeota archaeon]|nr:hypothetical protein [Candidatus Micrarchaeota archaeon]
MAKTMKKVKETGCCKPFDPAPWDCKTFVWKNKLFLKDRVLSIFHIPLNMGKVIVRDMEKIKAAGAEGEQLMLCDECSPFGLDVYIAVKKPVPGAETVRLSGTFMSQVYQGAYSDVGKWVKDMEGHVAAKGRKIQKLYFYYTMCPACAKAYGQNYTVLVAKI